MSSRTITAPGFGTYARHASYYPNDHCWQASAAGQQRDSYFKNIMSARYGSGITSCIFG